VKTQSTRRLGAAICGEAALASSFLAMVGESHRGRGAICVGPSGSVGTYAAQLAGYFARKYPEYASI
jgi:hypothetical protein